MTRSLSIANPVRLSFDQFELDEANAWLLRNGKAVALAPTPFSLLCALARQPGTLLTKDALLDTVWGHQFVSESVLKTAISDLRTALGDNARQPRFIETVSRRGYRFIAVPAAASPTPTLAAAPASTGPKSSPSFIGRADAFSQLHQAWDQACNGQRAVVWVAGEPGIGKTTLIEHFVAGLGIVCARGQCVEHHGVGEPYLPVLEALSELCRGDPSLPALLRSVAPTWLLQLPWLSTAEERDALRRELTGVGADRMLREMAELLDRYTEKNPLLLVTEDLHWSDRATIQLIDYVARRRGRARLMWLASFRLAEVIALDHPLNPLRHELRLQRLCREVVLDPFSETEVADYIAQRSALLARDEAFVRALHERTDGVPLFVSSVVAEVMERSADDAAVEARLAAVGVPENLAAIIDHYIARLDSESRAMLAAAAVCGVQFRIETLALALERDVASVALDCEELVRGQVWLSTARPGGGEAEAAELPYAFRHALFRQVLYDRTAPSARTQLHCQVGAALELERSAGVPVAAAELAMHFDRARQPMTALRYYVEAAEAALLHFSPASCMSLAERASGLLQQAPQGFERNSLEITLATLQGLSAFHSLGVGREAKNAFERAYALLQHVPGHAMRGRLLHAFGYVLSLRGEHAQALAVAERAEALSSAQNDPVLMLAACLVHGETRHIQGQSHAARSWFERGLAITEALDIAADDVFAADPQVTVLGLLAIELLRGGLVEQGRAHVKRARERACELRQPMTRLVATWHAALFEVRLGNANAVAALADDMRALVEEFSLGQGRTACQWFRGWADARAGRPLEGYRLIQEAYEQNLRLGMRAGASEVLGYAAEALLLAGDVDGAQAKLQEALQIADELAERVYLPQLLLLEAATARAGGRTDDAAASARRAVEEAREQEAPWVELLALADLCEHHGATAEDDAFSLAALAALAERLPEAADTDAARRARSLAPA